MSGKFPPSVPGAEIESILNAVPDNEIATGTFEGIVTHPAKMTGQELRFLRTEMGLTQAQLAAIIKVTLLTVSRWERNENPINDAAEMLIRLLALETLQLDVKLDVRSVSEKVTDSAQTQEILIDGDVPGRYRLLDVA